MTNKESTNPSGFVSEQKLKCPFCETILEDYGTDGQLICENKDCHFNFFLLTPSLIGSITPQIEKIKQKVSDSLQTSKDDKQVEKGGKE